MKILDADREWRGFADGAGQGGNGLRAQRGAPGVLHRRIGRGQLLRHGHFQDVMQRRAQARIDRCILDPTGPHGDQRLRQHAQGCLTASGAEIDYPDEDAVEAAADTLEKRLGEQPALADAGLSPQVQDRSVLRGRQHGGNLGELDLATHERQAAGRRPLAHLVQAPQQLRLGDALEDALAERRATHRLDTARHTASSSTISPGLASPTRREAKFTVSPSTV